MSKNKPMRKYKSVKGLITDTTNMKPMPGVVTLRVTSDKIGKSLSLQCANVMIQIPLEPVEDTIQLIEEVE